MENQQGGNRPLSRLHLLPTDYSSARKELIKRDMAFRSDEQQIRDILVAEIADNIKKDWEEVL